MHTLDAIDRKILSLLQSDSRTTMQELADKVGLSVSPCHRRVKLLEERGVITRYIATVDQKSLGLHVSVFISIKLARQKEEDLNRFAKAISKWDEVLECYLMTGNRDYLLRVVCAEDTGERGHELPRRHRERRLRGDPERPVRRREVHAVASATVACVGIDRSSPVSESSFVGGDPGGVTSASSPPPSRSRFRQATTTPSPLESMNGTAVRSMTTWSAPSVTAARTASRSWGAV
jgi:Lrp/AsnC family leucine-responsive transcriptional regulator